MHDAWANSYGFIYEESFGPLYRRLTSLTLEDVAAFAPRGASVFLHNAPHEPVTRSECLPVETGAPLTGVPRTSRPEPAPKRPGHSRFP
jgi:hypothetical protein